MNPYDLVSVSFSGVVIHARPTEFVYDGKNEPIKAIKLVTTCPKCGAFNEIDILTTFITEGMVLPVVCSQCGIKEIIASQPLQAKEELKPIQAPVVAPAVLIRQEESIKSKVVDVDDSGFVSNSVFVDPIALGTFQIEEL